MVTAFSPVTFFSTPPSAALLELGLVDGTSAFLGGVAEDVYIEPDADLIRERPPLRARFGLLLARDPKQLLLPLEVAAQERVSIEDTEAAQRLGAQLGQITRYLTTVLTRGEPVSISVIRTLARFIVEAERAEFNAATQRSFREGFLSKRPPQSLPANGATRESLQTRAVNNAKLLVLLSVLKIEDPKFLGRSPALKDVSDARTLFQNLSNLLVALDRVTERFEASNDSTRLEALLRLEQTLWTIESFLPWAKTLFPAGARTLESNLARQGLSLRGLIANARARMSSARVQLYRMRNGIPYVPPSPSASAAAAATATSPSATLTFGRETVKFVSLRDPLTRPELDLTDPRLFFPPALTYDLRGSGAGGPANSASGEINP